MANITDTLKTTPGDHSLQGPSFARHYVIEPVADGVEATGTHQLFEVGAQECLRSIHLVTLVAATSGGLATVQLKANDTLSGAVPVANLALKDSMVFGTNGTTGTTTFGGYANGTAYDVELVIGTAALTAGKFLLIAELVNVAPFA
jgi:hypothetical protein